MTCSLSFVAETERRLGRMVSQNVMAANLKVVENYFNITFCSNRTTFFSKKSFGCCLGSREKVKRRVQKGL